MELDNEELESQTMLLREIRKEYRIYSFDKALRTTVNRQYKRNRDMNSCLRCCLYVTCGAAFQIIYIAMTIL